MFCRNKPKYGETISLGERVHSMFKAFITIPQGDIFDTFVTEKALQAWKSFCAVSVSPYNRNLTAEEVCDWAQDADIIIAGWGTISYTEEVLAKLPKLKLFVYTAGSTAMVSPDGAMFKRGIKLLYGNEFFAKSVAEGCLCYTMCALRQIGLFSAEIKETGWRRSPWDNRGLFGKKVGIVGYGAISKYFCEYLKPFTQDILVYSGHMTAEEAQDKGLRKTALEEIFKTCDVVSIHTALKPETVGLVSRELMTSMKKDAVLVNTARGAVVDEIALIDLLRQGRIYAAIDVYSEEPLKGELLELTKLDRAFLMPHMGGPTIDMRGQITESLAYEVKDYLLDNKSLVNEVSASRSAMMSRVN